MKRRHALQAIPVTGLATTFAASGEGAPRAPFRTIYSNDTTHILSCRRPGPERDVPFTDGDLRQSIVEATGVDAHFLQPGLGWMPWWKSEIYPAEEHYRWLREEHGVRGVTRFGRYLLEGGDLLRVLVETCREMDIAPFLSFRLNDGHYTRDLADALEQGRPTVKMARHYWDNYANYRIGPDAGEWGDSVFDWAIPAVRDYKFRLIEEACRNYDLAGLELDFVRHWNRFGPHTTPPERREITSGFVARIRTMLDRTAREKGRPRRWLCVRIPANAAIRPDQGIDLAAMGAAGVDMFNLSHGYFTWQDDSVRHAREEIGDSGSIYAEMTHTTMTGRATAGSGTQPFLRTTDEQFYTTARLAIEQGGDGVSLFNFPYYRYHVTDTIGPLHEPPFHVLPRLKDRSFLERQPEWYFLSSGRNDPVLGEKPLPAILNRKNPRSFVVSMLERDERIPRFDGILRLRSDEPVSDRDIEVRVNGAVLRPIPPVVSPLPHPYRDTWLGEPDELACFALPASTPLRRSNEITILVRKGIRVRLIYLDVVFPAEG